MAKKRLVKKTVINHKKKTIKHTPQKKTGYKTPLTIEDMCPALPSALFDKNAVDHLKENSAFEMMAKPVNYKFHFTTTAPPNALRTFTEVDVFNALETFGNAMIDLLDAAITDNRQRPALKKMISAIYEREIKATKDLKDNRPLTLFTYAPLTPSLKNTEDTNGSLHASQA